MPFDPLSYIIGTDLFGSLFPDFVLAFAFFTSLIYGVLGKRFDHQRPAVAMSAAMGLALSAGLVWWEYINDYSIKDLGPFAAGFAIIVLGGVMYQAIRKVGGGWAGAAIALGATFLVGQTLGIRWPVDRQVVQTITTVALTVGILTFLLHRRGQGHFARATPEFADLRHDMADLHDDKRIANSLSQGFRRMRHKADHLHEHPEDATDIMLQLRRMLPAEGWLTERMSRLRARAHQVRQGHVARIKEISEHINSLPAKKKRKIARELSARYEQLKLDLRIERLDKAVAENERRIRDLTRQAQSNLKNQEYQKLSGVLASASKLQKHNERIFKVIDRTEVKLLEIAKWATGKANEVTPA